MTAPASKPYRTLELATGPSIHPEPFQKQKLTQNIKLNKTPIEAH
jgi:hypothetical protein